MFGLNITAAIFGSLGLFIFGLYTWAKWQGYKADKARADADNANFRAAQAEHRIKQRTELDHDLDELHERQRLERVEQYKRYEANKSLRDGLDDLGLYDGTADSHSHDTASDS